MKSNYLIKYIPSIILLFFIVILGMNNLKQRTNLRVLLWQTPIASLGTYIAISAGSGFIIAYLITYNIAQLTKPKLQLKTVKKYPNDPINKDYEEDEEIYSNIKYEKTLIERDFKEPAPTMDASFRVIGKKSNLHNESSLYQSKENYESRPVNTRGNESKSTISMDYPAQSQNSITSDWNDNSFENW